MTSSSYLTVKALTKYIKRKFDADPHLRDVYVMGELSNVKIHSSGHIYFTLKDDASRINATMFRSQAARLAFKPEEGMKVFIRGDVNVYESSGAYQLYAQTMEPDGIGGLFVAFNQLKERLQKEGLFNPNFKQPIPTFPKTVGVLTATTGAAIRDIYTTINRRFPKTEILIYPTLVQGAGAAPNIAENIYLANRQGLCDVLIVGRGGGSIEDLWAFNEEIVARAIFESQIPVISAVGHETDTTIADFVADLRAPTPTAAAELAVPNQQELYQRVLVQQSQLHQMITSRLNFERSRLTKLQTSYPLATPERLYRPFTEKLLQVDTALEKSMSVYFLKKKSEMQASEAKLKMHSPQHLLAASSQQLNHATKQLHRSMQSVMEQKKSAFGSVVRTLEALNPLALMNKGFSVTYVGDKVVKTAAELAVNDAISIQFQDGVAQAKIVSTQLHQKGE
ncbi:exodeoxyribonuclease VII large subunit [Solibacillus sp. FSL H8-0538]|uniref:exodeoxyribonuclease VII large subunit n=1 Tax=Solibacillus sp. FSL H8-0538 TaxID=2921400 RepID=UPI0030F4E67A